MYSDEVKSALREKINNPDKAVLCPQCGKPIEYKELGNSAKIECKQCGIKTALRGI